MGELKIDINTARLGAHWNNLINGRSQHPSLYDFGPNTYGAPGLFDSTGDQRAIKTGYMTTTFIYYNNKKQNKTMNLSKAGLAQSFNFLLLMIILCGCTSNLLVDTLSTKDRDIVFKKYTEKNNY